MTQTAGKRFFTPQEVSDRWENRVCIRTMANWRTQGNGPRFVKIGGRVLYPVDKLIEWEIQNTVESTSQYFSDPNVIPAPKPKQRPSRRQRIK